MAKKKNSRKALAVALGIMGIAGLSVASASSLDITPTGNIATGVDTFGDACDSAVNVAPVTTGTFAAMKYTSIAVTGISGTCDKKTLSWSVTYDTDPASDPSAPTTETGTVALDALGAATINIADLLVSGYTLGDIAITISD